MFAFFPLFPLRRARRRLLRRSSMWCAASLLALVSAACTDTPAPSLGPFEPPAGANATVVVGDTSYAFVAQCYDDDGTFEARGVASDGPNGSTVRMLLRIAPEESYVGIVFGEDEAVIEPALGEPLRLERDGLRVRGEDIVFVRDLDFRTKAATAAGTGSVQLDCTSVTPGTAPPR